MLFLTPNRQRQSTEGKNENEKLLLKTRLKNQRKPTDKSSFKGQWMKEVARDSLG